MARYLSIHALGCLPKPAFAALCRTIFASGGALRIIAGSVAEKMLVEFEAADAGAAAAWLRERKLVAQSVLRLDYESIDGSVRDL